MTRVRHATGVAGASMADGPTAVVDTFRAFTTAAVLLDRGIDALYLAADVDETRALAEALGGLTCGEVDGRKPADFALSNSPAEAADRANIAGRVVVQRTSAGTRSVVAALDAGAAPVYAASLVVGGATARALAGSDRVTIVSAGLHGTEPAEEDDLTAHHIARMLTGLSPPADSGDRVASTARAEELRNAPWAGARDVAIAVEVDRYDFAMQAVRTSDGLVRVVPERVP